MKTYGTKKILPVYGNSRPVERRINNKKIAGWKEQLFNDTSVSQNDTYNDSAFLNINGKSEQIQTIQGKNLFDAYNYTTNYPDDIKVINQDGEDWIKMQSSTKQIRYNLKVKENTQHTFTFEFKRYDETGSYSAVFVLYYTDGTNETIDFGYYGDGISHKVSKTSAENKTISYIRSSNYGNTVYFLLRVNSSQIEEGTTATYYEPFVPNSPSPDYPSAINSVSNFDLISTDGINQTQTINFPYTLRSLPDGTKDYIEIDNIAKTAKLYRYVGEKVFNGTESWSKNAYSTAELLLMQYWGIWGSLSASSSAINIISTHIKAGTAALNGMGYVIGRSFLCRISTSIAGDTVESFQEWLTDQYNAGTPFTIYYQLATPTIENLEYEEVTTYYPYTQIYTNAVVRPTLDGKIRIIEK